MPGLCSRALDRTTVLFPRHCTGTTSTAVLDECDCAGLETEGRLLLYCLLNRMMVVVFCSVFSLFAVFLLVKGARGYNAIYYTRVPLADFWAAPTVEMLILCHRFQGLWCAHYKYTVVQVSLSSMGTDTLAALLML